MKKYNIIFLVQNEVTWNCFSSIYKECLNSEEFNPIVMSLPIWLDTGDTAPGPGRAVTSDPSRGLETYDKNQNLVLDNEHIEYIKLKDISRQDRVSYMKSFDPAIVFIAAKDDGFFLPAFSENIQSLSTKFRFVYIPYYGATQVDVPIHSNAPAHVYSWKIIADSPVYVRYLLEDNIPASKIINFGHPKIEEIYGIRTLQGKWPIDNSGDKLKIIWAPHWSLPEYSLWPNGSINLLKFGTFLQTYKGFLNYAKNNPNVQIALRPHPMLQLWLRYHNVHIIFSEFLDQWKALPNTACILTGLYNELFAASDILVTDGISFLIEYPIATNKPVIFIDSGCHGTFNEIGLMGEKYAHITTSFDEVKELLDNPLLLEHRDASAIVDFLIPNYGNTARKIIESLHASLISEI